MGSKKLKAIAVRGSGSIPIADPEAFLDISRQAYQAVKGAETHERWVREGTTKTTEWVNTTGTLPSYNFRAGAFEEAPQLYADVARSYVVADKGCFSCPAPCGKYTYVRKYDTRIEGPDYETIAMLGPNVGLADWEALVQASWICDELGMDTISAGASISWAMECFDRGILTTEQAEGVDLNWGSIDGILTLLERIGRRQGWLGSLLAEGSKRAAETVGQGSERWAIQHKGMEQSAYETHSATAMLLSYMTSDIGGHHGRAWAIWHDMSMGREKSMPEKAATIIELQHIRPLLDCLGCCRFLWVELGISLESYAAAMRAVTGIDRSWDDLLFISERVWNLTRLYWAREFPNFGRSYDAPPPRFVSEPGTYGPTKGVFTRPEVMQKMLDDYYGQRGWDADGMPTGETLERLGLSGLRPAG